MAKRKGEVTAAKRERIHKLGPPPGGPANPEEWERELNRRLDEIVNGTAKTIPADEAIRQVREELRRRRGSR